jgi:hypothetical protein
MISVGLKKEVFPRQRVPGFVEERKKKKKKKKEDV